MSFRIQSGTNSRIIDELLKSREKNMILNTSTFPYVDIQDINKNFLFNTKEGLKTNNSNRNYLSSCRITNFDKYPITYHNQITCETFTIDWYYVDTSFTGFFKIYNTYSMVLGNYVNMNNYTFKTDIQNKLCLSIKDILKYYYYLHRDEDNYGLGNLEQNEIKNYKQLFQLVLNDNCITTNNKRIFGTTDNYNMSFNVYRSENELPEWENIKYLGYLIFFEPKKLGNVEIVKQILNLFVNGITENTTENIYYDSPVPLEQVYREHENLNNHNNRKTYNELKRQLKPKEKELIDNYKEFVIDVQSNSISEYSQYYTKNQNKTMNYPSFAYRKFLVSEWKPNYSSRYINDSIQCAMKYRKNDVVKHNEQKRGKIINQSNSTANYSLNHNIGYNDKIRRTYPAENQREFKFYVREEINRMNDDYNDYDDYDSSEEELYPDNLPDDYYTDEPDEPSDDEYLPFESEYDFCE